MNKGTLRSFFVWKYFFCINANLKYWSHFALQVDDLLNTCKHFVWHNTSTYNKTNLTSAAFIQLLLYLVYVKIFQIIPVICIFKLSKMMNVALRGLEIFLYLTVGDKYSVYP